MTSWTSFRIDLEQIEIYFVPKFTFSPDLTPGHDLALDSLESVGGSYLRIDPSPDPKPTPFSLVYLSHNILLFFSLLFLELKL